MAMLDGEVSQSLTPLRTHDGFCGDEGDNDEQGLDLNGRRHRVT